jgi:hypothetical protein
VEREENSVGWESGRSWFLADFRIDFLDAQAMKSTSIYRGGGGRGQSCLYWGKIATLDSAGNDLNCWLK